MESSVDDVSLKSTYQHWSHNDDLILLHQASRALSICEISRGSYSKGLDSLCDHVGVLAENEKSLFEDQSKSIADYQSRLKFLIHKVPKHRTLDQLITLCEINIYKQHFSASQKKFKSTSISHIDEKIFKKMLFWFIDEKIKAKKHKKLKHELENLKSKYFYRFLNFKNDDILRIYDAYRSTLSSDFSGYVDSKTETIDPNSQQSLLKQFPTDFTKKNNLSNSHENFTSNYVLQSGKTKKKNILLPEEPRMPPSNTYALFTKLSFKNVKIDTGSTDRLSRVSKEWKECSAEVKDQLAAELKLMNDEYIQKLAKFYISITDENIREIFESKHKSRMAVIKHAVDEILGLNSNN